MSREHEQTGEVDQESAPSANLRRRGAKPGARRPVIASAMVAAAAIGALLVVQSGGPDPGGAPQLDLVSKAAAAVAPTGQIEHVKSVVDGMQYEYWSLAGVSSRTVVTDSKGVTSEYQAGPVCSVLSQAPRAGQGCQTTGAALEAALSAGDARDVGGAVTDGRQVRRIQFSAPETGASGTFDVDAASFAPAHLSVKLRDGSSVEETYKVFEYLDASPQNRTLAGAPSQP